MSYNNTTILNNSSVNLTCASQADFGETFKQTKILVDVYFMTFVITGGLGGNILSFYVLRKIDNTEVQTYFLLSCLAVADSCYLITCVFFQITSTLYTFFDNVSEALPWFPVTQVATWPLANMSQTAAVCMVLLVSLDRYLAICFPLTRRWAISRRTAKLLVSGVVMFSIFFNFTTIFEQRITDRRDRCPNITKVDATVTDFFVNSTYQLVYKTILSFIVRTAGPFCLLLYLNMRLANVMRTTINYHARLRGESSTKETLNNTVIVVVIIFLLCFSPNLIYSILRTIKIYQPALPVTWEGMAYYSIFVNMTLTLNSATNFLIYCATGRRFKKKLKKMIFGEGYERPKKSVDIPLVDM